MLIILKQYNTDNLYDIWSTLTNRFLGVSMKYDTCIKAVMEYNGCIYEDARKMVDCAKPLRDILEYTPYGLYLEHTHEESKEIQTAVRIIIKHYEKDEHFRKAFRESVASALKEIPVGTGLYDIAEIISDRVMGLK